MKNLLNYNIPTHSPLWFKFRTIGLTDNEAKAFGQKAYKGGVGASEVGTTMYLTYKYDVCLEKFYQKAGIKPIDKTYDNAAMFFGRLNEEDVMKLWRCWNHTPEGYMKIWKEWQNMLKQDLLTQYVTEKFNVKEYKKWETSKRKEMATHVLYRTCHENPGYLVNPDFPHLFCSEDYHADDEMPDYNGVPQNNGFPIECKTMSIDRARGLGTNFGQGYHICDIAFENLNKGNYIIPFSYQVQVQSQMLITDTHYAELPIKIGSNIFQVNKYERNDKFCEFMIKHTGEFMEKVFVAREAKKSKFKAMMEQDQKSVDNFEHIIQRAEPLGDKEANYAPWVSANFETEEDKSIKGTVDVKEKAKQWELYRNIQKELKTRQTIIANDFCKLSKDNNAEKIDMDKLGYISWKKKQKASKDKSIGVKIKTDYQPEESFIKKIVSALPTTYK